MPRLTTPLSDDSILLHIGPHKTGTTAIQSLLSSARADLLGHGVTYPGQLAGHHRAARSLLGAALGWGPDQAPPPPQAWQRLAQTARATTGRVVISSEFFSFCDAAQRARAIEDLGRARVDVVIGARNPGALALSNWQQMVRSGVTDDLQTWLSERFRREAPGEASRQFWSTADPATLVEKWSDAVDHDRIRVIAIDDTDHELLPRSFEQLLDLPDGFLVGRPPQAHNRSLTAPEVELLRRAIGLTNDELTWPEFSLFFRQGLSARLLDVREPSRDEPRSALPPWAAELAAVEADAIVQRLRSSGVTVIGDLENLRRTPPAAASATVEQLEVDLAAEAVAGVVVAARERLRQAQAQIEALSAASARPPADERPTRELLVQLRARLRAVVRRRGRGR